MLSKKYESKLRMRLSAILTKHFSIHGLDVFIPPSIDAIVLTVKQVLREQESHVGKD